MKKKITLCMIISMIMLIVFSGNVFAGTFGDVDCDGYITASDARAVLRYSVELDNIDEDVRIVADVDHDGNILASDARIILRVSVNIQEFTHRFDDESATRRVIKEPSCTENGIEEITCICGAKTERKIPALGHDFIKVEYKSKKPTCTQTGVDYYVCSQCGEIKEEEVPALGHNFNNFYTVDKKPTCTEPGAESRHCKCCSEVTDQKIIPALGHNYAEPRIDRKPTCTEEGHKIQICIRCGYIDQIFDDSVKPTGHRWTDEKIVDKLPTCTENGIKSCHCLNEGCQAVKDEEIIPALGHVLGEGFVAVAPTCETPGLMRYNCKNCSSYYETKEIPPLGHDIKKTVVPPTCTEDGYTILECQREGCGYSEKTDIVKATGHNFIKNKDKSIEPTCTEAGKNVYECSECSAVKEEEVSALGHDFQYDAERSKAATCTEEGNEAYSCSRCGKHNDIMLPALGHKTEIISGKAPTCTETGLTEGIRCSVCGKILKEQQVIPAKGHSFGEWIVDRKPSGKTNGLKHRVCSVCGYIEEEEFACVHDFKVIDRKKADCINAGYVTYECSKCGYIYTEKVKEPLGHDYQESVIAPTCTKVGYTLHVCSRCNDTYKDSYVQAYGHKPVERNGIAPTCETAGRTPDIYCSVCNEILKEGTELSPLGHIVPDDFTVTEEPTCQKTGKAVKICARDGCNKILEEKILDKVPHSAQGQEYEYNDTGDVRVKRCRYCGKIILTEEACAAFINKDGSVKEYIFDFEKAVNTAYGGDIIRLFSGYVLKSDITVSKGVTLILPCRDNDYGYESNGFNPDGLMTNAPYSHSSKLYSEFTVPEGRTVNVYGTMLINAVTGRRICGSNTTYDVSGGYGLLHLNGNINVKNGGRFDCAGFADGKGTVTLEKGSTMYETFAIVKWRGGTNAFFNAYLHNLYPILETLNNNMKAELVINKGATYAGTVKACASEHDKENKKIIRSFCERFIIFDDEKGLIRLHEGATCTRTIVWDDELTNKFYGDTVKGTYRDVYNFNGGADFVSTKLSVAGYNLSTDRFPNINLDSPYFIFDGDMSFELYDGDYNFMRHFRFLPGFIMKAGNGAKINLKNNGYFSSDSKVGALVFHTEEYAVLDQEFMHYTRKNGTVVNSSTARYPLGRGDSYLELLDGSELNAEKHCIIAGNVKKHAGAKINLSDKTLTEKTLDVCTGNYSEPDFKPLKTTLKITETDK